MQVEKQIPKISLEKNLTLIIFFASLFLFSSLMKKFYITTAIAYMNAGPHAGHALEIIQTDALARMYRFLGYEVIFQTGSDDHGMKIRNASQQAGLEVHEFVNQNTQLFKALYKSLEISYDVFQQTSNAEKHYPWAQLMRKKLVEAGDIYKKSYKGLYCEGCEALKLEKDLVDGKCPDHPNKELQEIEEENYFFRLSKYRDQVAQLIKDGIYQIKPEIRKNEILAFLEKAEDVSFSRQKSKMPWGIPVPWDDQHVMYVWCDALTNYLTGQGFGINDQRETVWPADVHVIGKDILRFHAAFWPAMLLSAKLPLPKTLLAHGHLNLNGMKMSKSTGNVLDPGSVVEKYQRDPFVFNLLYDVALTSDGDFSMERFVNVYNSMLIWAWWNLVNRVVSLCSKYGINEWKVDPESLKLRNESDPDLNFDAFLQKIEARYLKTFDLQGYLQDWYRIVQKANEYITKAEPRKKWKEESTQAEATRDLQFLLYIVKNLTLLSAPILTQGFEKLKTILWVEALQAIDTSKNGDFSLIQSAFECKEFEVDLKPEILYARVED